MEEARVCKHNMRLYPFFRMLSFDFLFFYTINILFLTQVKGIMPSEILLVDSLYSLFIVIFQIPASFILDKTSRKKTLLLGTAFNCVYIAIIIMSSNIFHLIIAESVCAFGFSLKDIAAPSLLNESIPKTTRKSELFAKINGKAVSGYYTLNAVSLIFSGFLYNVNPYIPMFLSIGIIIISFLAALGLYEPLQIVKEKNESETDFSNLKESFRFILTSGRLKSLILYSSIMYTLIYILSSSEIYLLENLNISAGAIGSIFAFLGIVSGIAAKKQNKFHNAFRNKTLSVLGISISVAVMASTIGFFLKLPLVITLVIILACYSVKYITIGLYNVLIVKYLSNFTNEEIDSKIYTVQILVNSVVSVVLGSLASLLLDKFDILISMLVYGAVSFVLFVLTIMYMKSRLGLSPEQYDDSETKYSKVV